jgi:CheY-like chemotaxis protein
MIDQLIVLKTINFLYVDNEEADLKAFEQRLQRLKFNGEFSFEYNVETCDCYSKAVKLLDSTRIDVLLADFNMPENKNGLGFLDYINSDHPEIIKVLYTGNFSDPVVLSCHQRGYIYHFKNDELGILLTKIQSKLVNETTNSPKDPIYLQFSEIVISDIERSIYEYPDLTLYVGSESITPKQLISDIRKRNNRGNSYIQNYITGLNMLGWLKKQ